MSYNCNFCNNSFSTKTLLNRHKENTKYCIKIQNEINDLFMEPKIKDFKCEFCLKKFSSKQNLESHVNKNCLEKYKKIIETKDEVITSLKSESIKELKSRDDQLKDLEQQNRDLIKMNEFLSAQSNQQYVKELQDKIHEIALAAIETKNEKISGMIKKYVKKQPRLKYGNNVVYILTTPCMKKDRRYILGKAKNLTSRLSTYNKTDEHEVIFYEECDNENLMSLVETVVFQKLEVYREQANRERFILPDDKKIDLFINMIKDTLNFLR